MLQGAETSSLSTIAAVLVPVVAVENVIIGWLLTNLYRGMVKRIDGHDAEIGKLNEHRERTQIDLVRLETALHQS